MELPLCLSYHRKHYVKRVARGDYILATVKIAIKYVDNEIFEKIYDSRSTHAGICFSSLISSVDESHRIAEDLTEASNADARTDWKEL